MSFLAINAAQLSQWLGGTFLFSDRFTDMNLCEPDLDLMKRGPSSGASHALAICLLSGCPLLDGGVGVTGYVDLRGRIMMVGKVREKIQRTKEEGIGRMVVPQKNLELLNGEGWPEVDQQYVHDAVRGAHHFIDVMTHSLQGEI